MKAFLSSSSVLRPLSSVLRPLSSVFLLLLTLSASAQDDLFITVSTPLSNKTFSTQESDMFTTVSSPAAQPATPNQPVAVVKPVVKPLEQPVSPVKKSAEAVAPVAAAKEPAREWEQELLRDPFWPVGFFPEGWQKKKTASGSPDADVSGWNMAAGKIKISGTSRLGGRTAAFVNGDLKSTGDQIEVMSEGKTYQWQIIGIEADGRVQLKKLGIK
jgi:hypothetical protein